MSSDEERVNRNINVEGLISIPTKCPTCGEVGDFYLDPNKYNFFGILEFDKDTHGHILECPYCTAGMLLCIRKGNLITIEPFEDNSQASFAKAIESIKILLGE